MLEVIVRLSLVSASNETSCLPGYDRLPQRTELKRLQLIMAMN